MVLRVMFSCRCFGMGFFPAGLVVPRNAPPVATTRHSEFIPPELAAVEGAQDRFHLAAEMRFDPHAAPFQSP
jgi:hypothetical protein